MDKSAASVYRCPECGSEQPEPGTCGRCPGTVREADSAASVSPTLEEVRELLGELYYVADGGGEIEADLAQQVERTMRWLLNAYLRPGVNCCNWEPTEADRVA